MVHFLFQITLKRIRWEQISSLKNPMFTLYHPEKNPFIFLFFPPTSVMKESCLIHFFFFPYLWCFSDLRKTWRVAFTRMQPRDHVDHLPDINILHTCIHLPVLIKSHVLVFCAVPSKFTISKYVLEEDIYSLASFLENSGARIRFSRLPCLSLE